MGQFTREHFCTPSFLRWRAFVAVAEGVTASGVQSTDRSHLSIRRSARAASTNTPMFEQSIVNFAAALASRNHQMYSVIRLDTPGGFGDHAVVGCVYVHNVERSDIIGPLPGLPSNHLKTRERFCFGMIYSYIRPSFHPPFQTTS